MSSNRIAITSFSNFMTAIPGTMHTAGGVSADKLLLFPGGSSLIQIHECFMFSPEILTIHVPSD